MREFLHTPESEFRRLERQVGDLRQLVADLTRRRENAGDWGPPFRMAILQAQLDQGGTAQAKLYEWSGTAWRFTGAIVTVREFTLNLTEYYPAGIKGWVKEDIGGIYVFATDVCDPDDTGLWQPPPGSQSGGSSGALLGSTSDPLLAELAAAVDASLALSPDGGFYDDQLIPR